MENVHKSCVTDIYGTMENVVENLKTFKRGYNLTDL